MNYSPAFSQIQTEEFPLVNLDAQISYSLFQQQQKQLIKAEGLLRFLSQVLESDRVNLGGNPATVEVIKQELAEFMAMASAATV